MLLTSVALNVFLFAQGREYYLQLHETRLDPLGLDYGAPDPDATGPAGPERTTVVFFGDSRAAEWPAPDLGQYRFVNRGVGSQTSAQVVRRFDAHVRPLQPRLVILQVGINDLKTIPLFPERKVSIVARCQENIRQIVSQSTDLGATVILTTIFPVGRVPVERRPFWSDEVAAAVDEVNAYIRSLAGEQVVVLDAFAILADERGVARPEYSRDLLHLNEAGYEALNEALARSLGAGH